MAADTRDDRDHANPRVVQRHGERLAADRAPAASATARGAAAMLADPAVPTWGGAAPAAAARPQAAEEAHDRLVERARFGELFVLFIINLLLSILTLGIYRFWGKTRIRKYLWSHMSFRGEPFEYAGTGLELFIGFLVAFLIFGPPFVGFYVWITLDPPSDFEQIGYVYLAASLLGFIALYFIHVAVFAAYRYRVSRTLWHGIRGTVSGSAWAYGFLGFGLGMLNGLSLFWTKPWADTVLIRYRLGKTTVGSEPVRCELQAGPLYGSFAIAWVSTAIASVVIIGGLIALIMEGLRSGRRPDLGLLIVTGILLYLLVPLVWLVTINWYRAAFTRNTASATRFQGLAFAFPVRGWALLKFNFANFFIILFSLGLLVPLVVLRYARFVQRYLVISGPIDYVQLRQSSDRGPRLGEGMAEFFGLGLV